MDKFEIVIRNEAFKVIPNNTDHSFSVFNHTTCHTINKTDFGVWQSLDHRFGKDNLPFAEIGNEIEKHNDLLQTETFG